MPYIDKESRLALLDRKPATAGELNYAITQLCRSFADGSYSYSKFNEIVGVLECCKLEFYRRLVSPYEDKKAELNGEVYL